jgi:hypothetical protein
LRAPTQRVEVGGIDRRGGCRGGAGQHQAAQLLAVLFAADQLAHVLAAGAVAALLHLLVDEGLQSARQGDVHRAHGASASSLANLGEHRAGDPPRPVLPP